jgi:hypothetical protein
MRAHDVPQHRKNISINLPSGAVSVVSGAQPFETIIEIARRLAHPAVRSAAAGSSVRRSPNAGAPAPLQG